MHDLNYQLRGLCKRCNEGSFATQAARWRCLDLAANQLHELEFRHLSANGLKPKHILALLDLWKKQCISSGTIKNRLAHLRWWAEKVNKPNIIPASNSELGVDARSYIPATSKAMTLTDKQLNLISDPFIKCSLLLQQAFGLRREESIKFMPSFADKGDSIHLKGSWCKGGQPRIIPITNDNQRIVLDMAHSLAGKGSLIPSYRSYVQQLKVYESQTSRAGLHNLHGLRHNYAQERFYQLTGLLCSAAAASSFASSSLDPDDIDFIPIVNDFDTSVSADTQTNSQLSLEQKELKSFHQKTIILSDECKKSKPSNQKNLILSNQQKELIKQARLTISNELGHHRLQVTSVYLGKPLTSNPIPSKEYKPIAPDNSLPSAPS